MFGENVGNDAVSTKALGAEGTNMAGFAGGHWSSNRGGVIGIGRGTRRQFFRLGADTGPHRQ